MVFPNRKLIAAGIAAVLVIGGLALTFHENEEEDGGPIVARPGDRVLSGIDPSAELYVLSEEAYGAAPSIAPLWPRAGISTSIGHTSESGLSESAVPWDDASRISSEVAITFWDSPAVSIVAGDYSDALRMVPLAIALDAPLLLWGDTTAEALWTLGTVMPDEVIVCGETPLNAHRGRGLVVLGDDYLAWTLETMCGLGMETDYLVVTNPDDGEGSADVPHLSAFAGLLAAHRGAAVLTCGPNGTDVNASVHAAYDLMELYGFEPHYVAMVGDADALQFLYRDFENYEEDGMPSENPVPSDNWYADRDGDPFSMEVSAGRLIARSLPDMSRYFERLLFYDRYLAAASGPAVAAPAMNYLGEWNNNGMVYCALAAEFDTRSLNEVWKDMYLEGEFNAEDASAPAHVTESDYPKEVNPIVNKFTFSNLIAINADHGNPGSTVTFDAADILPLHPGVTFAVSCNLGRIDDLDEVGYSIDTSICYSFMANGLLTYVAPTRVTYGVVSSSTLDPEVEQDDNKAGNGLCRLFFERLIIGDLSVGDAFLEATNALYDSPAWDETFNDEDQAINLCVIWEYQVYGDPAFNPYEPVNEGS